MSDKAETNKTGSTRFVQIEECLSVSLGHHADEGGKCVSEQKSRTFCYIATIGRETSAGHRILSGTECQRRTAESRAHSQSVCRAVSVILEFIVVLHDAIGIGLFMV